ncbi:GNAT family N-acetyltransferase [Yoonia sp.]|nr:GNAT family N-acetyltransferase [Yoonia sp.]
MTDIFKTAIITTQRLRLEPFAIHHAPYLNAINNEPQVMEFLTHGRPEPIEKTHATIARVRERWERLGYSWWAIIVRDTDSVIGAACVQNVANKAGAELEIGWRLATASTGHGYATEAGKAASDYAFDVISAAKVIAVADPKNIASHRVMERVGMTFRGIETHYDESCTTYVMQKPDRDG